MTYEMEAKKDGSIWAAEERMSWASEPSCAPSSKMVKESGEPLVVQKR